MATTNEKRTQLYNTISEQFPGPLTKDGILIKVDDVVVVIKVTMKKNFDWAAETGVFATKDQQDAAKAKNKVVKGGIPYTLDDPRFLDVCTCIRGYYNLPSDEVLLHPNGEKTRYMRDYYALLNHCHIPRKWIPDHLWAIIGPSFQEKILEKFPS